jgi:hypothetical protein
MVFTLINQTKEPSTVRRIALIGAATLFSASVALAQSNSSPDSTAGGAAGTSKQNPQQQMQQNMQPNANQNIGVTGAGAGRKGPPRFQRKRFHR